MWTHFQTETKGLSFPTMDVEGGICLSNHKRSRLMNVVVYQKNILGLKISFIFSLRLLVSVLALDQVVRV